MLRALIWKEWREQRSVMLAGIGIAAVLPFFMMAGLSVDRQNTTFGDVLEALLIALLAFVWPLFAAAAGAITIATESGEGTLRFLLSRPVSRSKVWAIKVSSAAGAVAAVAVFSLVVIWVVNRLATIDASAWSFSSIMRSLSPTFFDPMTLVSMTVLLFACSVLFSSLLNRPLTAAAAGLASALILLSFILVTWSRLSLLPRLEPQWLAMEVTLVSIFVLMISLGAFARGEFFRGDSVLQGRVLVSAAAVFVVCIGVLPMVFANARLASDEVSIQRGTVALQGSNVVMTVADATEATTQIWLLHTDGSGIARLTGRHTFAPTFLTGSRIAYLSRRGLAGGRTDRLDLRVVDRNGTRDRLVYAGMRGGRRLFYSLSLSLERFDYLGGVAFVEGSELVLARLDGRYQQRIDIGGTPLAGATILGWTMRAVDELLFVAGVDEGTQPGRLGSGGWLGAHDLETGESRVVRELGERWLLPELRRDSTGLRRASPSALWRHFPLMVMAEDGGVSLELVDVLRGETLVIDESLVAAGEPSRIRNPIYRCLFARADLARTWRRDDGRRFNEPQILFADCADEAAGAEGGSPNLGVVRLRGLDSGDERSWRIPSLGAGSLRHVYLSPAQDSLILAVARPSDLAESYAVVVDLQGNTRAYPQGWVAMGWLDEKRFLVQRITGESIPGGESIAVGESISFAVGHVDTGQLEELYTAGTTSSSGGSELR